MSYHHLNTFERGSIEALHQEGNSLRYIAGKIGCSASTISRELRRCPGTYSAQYAHWQYSKLRQHSGPKGKSSPKLISLIEQQLALTLSPEQIAHTSAKGQVSTKTIYNWLYAGKLLNGDLRALRQKGKRRNPSSKRALYTVGRSISQRPADVDLRQKFGHWELDTVWSCKGERAGLVTLVERKSRFYIAIKVVNRTAVSTEQAISRIIELLPKTAFLTATCDRGKEFSCWKTLEQQHQNVKIYFAHAFRAGERGCNENSNGLLREFFPKSTDFSKVTQGQLALALRRINFRPRKCLNWKTPIDVFLHEVLHLT